MTEFICPGCGEEEELLGERLGDDIREPRRYLHRLPVSHLR